MQNKQWGLKNDFAARPIARYSGYLRIATNEKGVVRAYFSAKAGGSGTGLLTVGGARGGHAAPLACRLLRMPTHILLNMYMRSSENFPLTAPMAHRGFSR